MLYTALIFLVYAKVVGGQFLTADDLPGIVNNDQIKSFSRAVLEGNLTTVIFSLIYYTVGFKAWAFHLVSLCWHVVNTSLVFILAYLLLGKTKAAWSALLFALHPVNTEAVAWISAQIYLAVTCGSLLTLISYVLYRQTQNRRYLLASLTTLVLSMILLRSPWVFMGILLVIHTDLFFFNKLSRGVGKIWALYLLPALPYAYYFWNYDYLKRVKDLATVYGLQAQETTPVLNRAPYTIFMMLKLLFAPQQLSIYHEGEVLTSWVYVGMIAITMLFLVITLRQLKNRTLAGYLLAALPLSIAVTFSPILVSWFIAERYLYFTSVFAVLLISWLVTKMSQKHGWVKYAAALYTLVFAVQTFMRAGDFSSSKALWTATQLTNPLSYRVYNNLSDVSAQEKNYDQAIKYLETAISINPQYAEAYHNLGYNYLLLNQPEKAKENLKKSLELNPGLYQAYVKLAYLAEKQGKTEEARMYQEKALEINPQAYN